MNWQDILFFVGFAVLALGIIMAAVLAGVYFLRAKKRRPGPEVETRDIDDVEAEIAEEPPLVEDSELEEDNSVSDRPRRDFSFWKNPWLWAVIAAPILHLIFSSWLDLVSPLLIWIVAFVAIFAQPVITKFKLVDYWKMAMADLDNPKKGLVWTLAYWGVWALVWGAWLVLPVLILIMSWFLSGVPVLNRILEQAAAAPILIIVLSLVIEGMILMLYSWKLFPEGVLVREIVLKKTSRTLAGGKYRFYHPLATLRGYFSGEHTVDDERTDATVRDSKNFDWIADMAIVIKFQDVTKLAGGEFERDLDSLKLSDPEDLTTFDPARVEASQILKRAYVVVQNGAQIGAKTLTPDAIQGPDGRQKIAEAVNEAIKKDIYQKDSAENVLLDEQQPFIIKAQTNQITATPRTAQSLGLIAEVQTLKDNGMLDDETSKEYLLRKATGGGRGGGSTIIEKSGRKKN